MPGTNSKPDFLDMDGDGDKQEPMRDAAKDPAAQKFKDKKMAEVMSKRKG
jgi:hypothetical protein|tara:strand:- start:95 stop:244 length:150 start_codon:yes stop_codon:yes gene_type:complete